MIGAKAAARGRVLLDRPLQTFGQLQRVRPSYSDVLMIRKAFACRLTLPVSTTTIGTETIRQLEANVALTARIVRLSAAELRVPEKRTLPFVWRVLCYCRRDLGA
ncbi:MAG: hypothetical protein ACUVS7_18500 [Bryobacteraceae bacterium]